MKIQIGKHECHVRLEDSYKNYTNIERTRHCNAEYELFVLLDGSCTLEVEEQCYELKRGEGLFVLPSRFHCPVSLSENARLLVLPFAIKDKPFDIARDCVRLSLSAFAMSAAKNFLSELKTDAPFRIDAVSALCSLLIVEAFRLIGYGEDGGKMAASKQSKHRLDLIDNFFDKQLSADASEEELARQLHLSRRQLNRILVASYGMCFREKLLRSKMDRAAFLLRKTEKSISEIAEDVGYLSVTAFFKAFKARHGISPKKYRESFYKAQNV